MDCFTASALPPQMTTSCLLLRSCILPKLHLISDSPETYPFYNSILLPAPDKLNIKIQVILIPNFVYKTSKSRQLSLVRLSVNSGALIQEAPIQAQAFFRES